MSDARAELSLEKVFLSDVEIHRQSPFAKAADLRARVLFHVLLSDVLLIGDSQCLNTPLFRALVDPREAEVAARNEAVRADLGTLLDGGRIRVARRDGQSLGAVRASQKLREVEHVPSAGYAEDMDRRTAAHPVSYQLDTVAAAFKAGVLALVEQELRDAGGETRRTLEAAHAFMSGEKPLFFKAIRDWEDAFRDASGGRTPEVILALGAVDRAAGEAYRQALPTVLGACTAAPRGAQAAIGSSTARVVQEQNALPAGMLDEFLLGRLPVEVFLEATEQPSRNAMVHELALLRRGDGPDPARLGEAVTEFSAWMQEAFIRTFRDTDERAREVLAGKQNLMRFAVSEDETTGALGAGLDVWSTDGTREDYLDVQVLDRSVPDANGVAGTEPMDERRMRRRLVQGSAVGGARPSAVASAAV
ncbi:hypothetical protein ACFQ6Q_23015 [Streptomyces sp. NPDC056437]|uniref:hypothetical protein n=1 Tax=Streptomyces sp. NPDC056437 TaxID=3345816 RepID=UPI00368E5025